MIILVDSILVTPVMHYDVAPAISNGASWFKYTSANPAILLWDLHSLSKRTTTEGLREAFSKFGQVVYARVVTDRVSGYSKGFGFVRYATLEEAAEGIKGMDGKFLDGWVIFAEYARARSPPPPNGAPSSGLP
ncbi:glycine-rich RNA-binding protein 3, mitochondrial-like protein [Cinnamomum micranthum f. kanehirae]|uniref:Glycine-rich RNA-binding protein 3, mitochondrial-like protein n=1 Tax=Cinnamomum micranthum f. kanehirae TaxID=337451 RepID=A0A443PRU6_9MAGN|nr:glycine-rich RNA-binding protein 3, mitochondrial-like protein [Cinnamomum micranthum f. kanehirae]